MAPYDSNQQHLYQLLDQMITVLEELAKGNPVQPGTVSNLRSQLRQIG
jgi:hypothetical protein